MVQRLTVLVAAIFLLLLSDATAAPPGRQKERPLGQAVAEFNRKAMENATGKTQPPLTEDEVIAAIRGWLRTKKPVPDEYFDRFLTIADTRMMPPEATLEFMTSYTFNGYKIEVWCVDLCIQIGRQSWTFRLRDQKLRSQPETE